MTSFEQNFPAHCHSTVYIMNVPYTADENELARGFEAIGEIVNFKICRSHDGRSMGQAYCQYGSHQDAARAISSLNGVMFEGRRLKVLLMPRSRIDTGPESKVSPEPQIPLARSSTYHGAKQNAEMISSDATAGARVRETRKGESGGQAKAGPQKPHELVENLPSESMFGLLKMLKEQVVKDAVQARKMLVENPPLAFASLQALSVMGLVDQKEALQLLQATPSQHQSNPKSTSEDGYNFGYPPDDVGSN